MQYVKDDAVPDLIRKRRTNTKLIDKTGQRRSGIAGVELLIKNIMQQSGQLNAQGISPLDFADSCGKARNANHMPPVMAG